MTGVRDRLAQAGVTVPTAVAPVANYQPCVVTGGPLLYVSGQGTREDGVFQYVGKIGAEFSVEDGYRAARICGINLLAQVEAHCGLDRIRRVVKLTGFVNSAPDFAQVPAVLDGASDLMVAAFGERGRHARSAVGVASLPSGMAVEVEGIFEIELSA